MRLLFITRHYDKYCKGQIVLRSGVLSWNLIRNLNSKVSTLRDLLLLSLVNSPKRLTPKEVTIVIKSQSTNYSNCYQLCSQLLTCRTHQLLSKLFLGTCTVEKNSTSSVTSHTFGHRSLQFLAICSMSPVVMLMMTIRMNSERG